MTRYRSAPSRAFTLIELLVVVAIISLLISILLPSLTCAREQAKAAKCGANLNGIGKSVFACFTENKDFGPAWDDGEYLSSTTSTPNLPMYTWVDVLFDLDYIGDWKAGICPSDRRPDELAQDRALRWGPAGKPYVFVEQPGIGEQAKNGVRTSYALNSIMHYGYRKDRFDADPARQIYAVDGWWNWFASYNASYLWTTDLYGKSKDPLATPDQYGTMVGWRHGCGKTFQANTLFLDGHVENVQPKPPKNVIDANLLRDGTDTVRSFTWLPDESSTRGRDAIYTGTIDEYKNRIPQHADSTVAKKYSGPAGGQDFHPPGYPDQLSPNYRTQTNTWRKLPSAPNQRI